jgi:hypothetical protein
MELPKSVAAHATRFGIVSGQSVTLYDGPFLNQSERTQYSNVLGQEVLMYPDGPVEMTVWVTVPTKDKDLPVQLTVTYEACNANSCLPAVVDKRFTVTIPAVKD